MANTELMDTEDELQFYQDIHAILDDAKSKTYETANNIHSCRGPRKSTYSAKS